MIAPRSIWTSKRQQRSGIDGELRRTARLLYLSSENETSETRSTLRMGNGWIDESCVHVLVFQQRPCSHQVSRIVADHFTFSHLHGPTSLISCSSPCRSSCRPVSAESRLLLVGRVRFSFVASGSSISKTSMTISHCELGFFQLSLTPHGIAALHQGDSESSLHRSLCCPP